ncbi:MAG: monovalent cation/H(+) antiporter subunit G [Candidatus Marinimicrobia bacterium]|nr:monovalent cation/H(+) antiporter subunit G [Candidatus Neomarinimicrobiota bacterium]
MIGAIIALIGSIFLLLGALGLLRMPDVYNRMQAGTKSTTLGSMLFLIGAALYISKGQIWSRVILLILFIVFTNPISSHALARAAHKIKIPMAEETVKDDLTEDE